MNGKTIHSLTRGLAVGTLSALLASCVVVEPGTHPPAPGGGSGGSASTPAPSGGGSTGSSPSGSGGGFWTGPAPLAPEDAGALGAGAVTNPPLSNPGFLWKPTLSPAAIEALRRQQAAESGVLTPEPIDPSPGFPTLPPGYQVKPGFINPGLGR